MTYDEKVAEMKTAGFVVEHYPGIGKAFATSDDEFLEAKNVDGVYRKFKKLKKQTK